MPRAVGLLRSTCVLLNVLVTLHGSHHVAISDVISLILRRGGFTERARKRLRGIYLHGGGSRIFFREGSSVFTNKMFALAKNIT